MTHVLTPTAAERQNSDFLDCCENCEKKDGFHNLNGIRYG